MSEMKGKPDKQALLKDLEQIRASLSDHDFGDEIPVLTENVSQRKEDTKGAEEDEEVFFDEKRIFDDYEGFDDDSFSSDKLRDVEERASGYEIAYGDTLEQEMTDVLEGQQSLFDGHDEFTLADLSKTGIRPAIEMPLEGEGLVLPAAHGENPFLPKHVRERLTQGKNSFLEEIALVNESLKKGPTPRDKSLELPQNSKPETSAPSVKNKTKTAYEKIVDDLVAEYLPQLETALREQLMQLIEEKDK